MRNLLEQRLPTDIGQRVDIVLGILAIIVLTFDLVIIVFRQAG